MQALTCSLRVGCAAHLGLVGVVAAGVEAVDVQLLYSMQLCGKDSSQFAVARFLGLLDSLIQKGDFGSQSLISLSVRARPDVKQDAVRPNCIGMGSQTRFGFPIVELVVIVRSLDEYEYSPD